MRYEMARGAAAAAAVLFILLPLALLIFRIS